MAVDPTTPRRVNSAPPSGVAVFLTFANYADQMFLPLGGLFGLIAIAVWLWAIYDSITAPTEGIRYLPKAVWVIIVLLFADLGAIAWFVLGRPRAMVGSQRTAPWPGTGGSSRRPPRGRMIAPDDDPDFLRGLNRPKPDDDPRT